MIILCAFSQVQTCACSRKYIVINAAHRGHKAPAAKGETFSTALVSVLRESQGKGIPLSDLQKKIDEEYSKLDSKNSCIVTYPSALKNIYFPY